MKCALALSLPLLFLVGCQSPESRLTRQRAAQDAKVESKSQAAAQVVSEKDRAEFAKGFVNGVAMIRKSLETGRRPYLLKLGEVKAQPKLLSALPEGVEVEAAPENPEIELDPETGLRVLTVDSSAATPFQRGEVEGLNWALHDLGAGLMRPRPRPTLPTQWVYWSPRRVSIELESPGRRLDLWRSEEALLWKASGLGFPGEFRWRPMDAKMRPRLVALQEDVLWVDTEGYGAVALDLDGVEIRDIQPSFHSAETVARMEAQSLAEEFQALKMREQEKDSEKEQTPEATLAKNRERAAQPEAQARYAALKKEAEAGNPESMVNLAFHLSGLGETEDREAAQWIQKSAEMGCKTAMTALGAWHFEGRCVEKSVALSRQWLEKAMAAGDLEAKNLMATLHR